MSKIARLTDLEIKIMRVLWENDHNLTIQEIVCCLPEEKLSDASVRQVMKRLVNKKAVRVMESILVATVYARTFEPCYTQEEYMAAEIERLQNVMFEKKKPNAFSMMAAFLHNSDAREIDAAQMDELQKIIEKKKNQIQGSEK